MKWIQRVLLNIQSRHDCVHRRTNGRTDGQIRWNQYTPLSTSLKRGYNNFKYWQYLVPCKMRQTQCILGTAVFLESFKFKFKFKKVYWNTYIYTVILHNMTVPRWLQTLSTRCKQNCIKFRYSITSESMRILEAVKGLWVLYLALWFEKFSVGLATKI